MTDGEMDRRTQNSDFIGCYPTKIKHSIKRKDKMTMVRQKYQLTPKRDTDEQKILEFDCTTDTPGYIQVKVAVLDATFL